MIKRIIILSILILCNFSSSLAHADNDKNMLIKGVKKYKEGNYLGAVQIMQDVIKESPDNAMAYYYMAISNVKLGNSNDALVAYDKVIALSPGSQLAKYSVMGKKMMRVSDTKLSGVKDDQGKDKTSKVKDVEKDIEERNIKYLIEKINKNKTVDPVEYKKFQDYSQSKSSIEKPSSEEIAKAMEVLTKAGINPYTNTNSAVNPEMMQMGMLNSAFGGMNGGGQQASGNYMNMMPLMMMMQGQNGANNNIDPQFMQTMLTNMMMPSMDDFSSKKDY